jgi:hypothetical protein
VSEAFGNRSQDRYGDDNFDTHSPEDNSYRYGYGSGGKSQSVEPSWLDFEALETSQPFPSDLDDQALQDKVKESHNLAEVKCTLKKVVKESMDYDPTPMLSAWLDKNSFYESWGGSHGLDKQHVKQIAYDAGGYLNSKVGWRGDDKDLEKLLITILRNRGSLDESEFSQEDPEIKCESMSFDKFIDSTVMVEQRKLKTELTETPARQHYNRKLNGRHQARTRFVRNK